MKSDNELVKEFEEKQKSSEDIYNGKVVHLYRDTVSLPDGKEGLREVVRHVGAVCVVPVTDDGEVVLVRQYRYAVENVLWEIPAGKLDSPDEDPLSAAKRELSEETGAEAGKIEKLGMYLGSPAILDEKIYMYLATDLSFGKLHLDEDEFLSVERLPIMTVVDMINNGEIPDGKTQCAVLRAALMLGYFDKK